MSSKTDARRRILTGFNAFANYSGCPALFAGLSFTLRRMLPKLWCAFAQLRGWLRADSATQ